MCRLLPFFSKLRTLQFVLAFVAILTGCGAFAQEYFVSPSGSDSDDGKLESPFKTIQHAANLAGAGDTVTIRAGTYRETVRPANNGTSDAPIVFRNYNGETAVISGADPITDWMVDEGRIYKAAMLADFYLSAVNYADQIFADGKMLNLARWPNTTLDVSRPVKSTLTKFISKKRAGNMTTVVFEDSRLTPASDGYYVGAEIYIQPNNAGWGWTLSGVVTAQKADQLTIQSHSNNGQDGNADVYAVGARYYLFNQRRMLDTAGEWLHDKAANSLYVWMPDGGTPEGHIEARKRDFAFNLDNKSYITIRGLTLFACTITTDPRAADGIPYNPDGSEHNGWRNTLNSSSHVVIDGVKAKYLSHFTDVSGHFFLQWTQNTGIVLSGSNHIIRNCEIQFSAGNGISLLGPRHKCLNNVILDTDYASVDCNAISTGPAVPTSDTEIAFNSINRCGRSGIGMRGFANASGKNFIARCHHNDVANFMLQDWDGGAFYVFGADGKFARIDHNFFHCDNASGLIFGAYWDYSKNYILDHNVIWGVPTAIQLTGAYKDASGVNNMLIYNNTASSNDSPWGRSFTSGPDTGTIIQNNILKVCAFKNPNGGVWNHWPAYAKGTPVKNLLWGRNDKGGHNKVDGLNPADFYAADVKFVNLTAADFHLGEGSPAIDAGIPFVEVNRDNINVPPFNDAFTGAAPDVGAFEFGGELWTAGATSANPKGDPSNDQSSQK